MFAAQRREDIPMAPAGNDRDGTRPIDEALTKRHGDVCWRGRVKNLRIGDGSNDACKHDF